MNIYRTGLDLGDPYHSLNEIVEAIGLFVDDLKELLSRIAVENCFVRIAQ